MQLKLFIGTSGYSYSHWKETFYPPDTKPRDYLAYYATRFNSVELNVTFYHLPQIKTFAGWHDKTPEDFRFVIKGSRYITHVRRLIDIEEPLTRFFSNAAPLSEKLLGVLWQFPQPFALNIERLRRFADLLAKHRCFHSFEFRHPSWFCEETYALLRSHNMNLCIAHSGRYETAFEQTSDFVYLRFHGGQELYGSEYSEKELMEWAALARRWLGRSKFLCAFFNNDYHGYAVKNARQLREYLENVKG
ncbi:MAG TPA: DUF72 domain-containing protein [Chitinivibrionales bacterium]|nr:DUF72 domain-containing protein [Chitinivibrionales bacterium]